MVTGGDRMEMRLFAFGLFRASFVVVVKVMSHAVASLKHKLKALLAEKPIVSLHGGPRVDSC